MNCKRKGSRPVRHQPSLFDDDEERTCLGCGHIFLVATSSRQRYCGHRCKAHASYRRVRARYRLAHPQLRLRSAPPVYRGADGHTWKGGIPTWTCAQCGRQFTAYSKQDGNPRQFCSWRCANQAHRRGADDMRARLRFEQCCIDDLNTAGWWCLRSAGSRGPVDVFAFNAQEIRIIQVKSTRDPLASSALGMFATAIEQLRTMPKPPALSRWLYIKLLRHEWVYLNIDELPIDRPTLRAHLRTYFERRKIEAA